MATVRETLSALAFSTVCSVSLSGLIASTSVQAATLTTLTFNELPTQPVDDLSFMGVNFDFKVNGEDSTDAIYNVERNIDLTGIGGEVIPLDPSPPVLEISTPGILTLDFITPTGTLMFDVAREVDFRFESTPVFTVELFDEAMRSLMLAEVGLNEIILEGLPSPLRSVVVGSNFAYSGTPIKRTVIDFRNTVSSSVGFDNLTYKTDAQHTPVPEPASILGLLALGAFGAGSVCKRQLRKNSTDSTNLPKA